MAHTIGELARRTGCKVQTIRYYETIGLMPAPLRSTGNQRLYDRSAVDRPGFIPHGRELGFSLPAVRELLTPTDDPDAPRTGADRADKQRRARAESRLPRP